jgi:hypothetical protein
VRTAKWEAEGLGYARKLSKEATHAYRKKNITQRTTEVAEGAEKEWRGMPVRLFDAG